MIEGYTEVVILLLKRKPRPSIQIISKELKNRYCNIRGYSSRL